MNLRPGSLAALLIGLIACHSAPPAKSEVLPNIRYGSPQADVARQFGLPAEAAPTVGGCRYWQPLGLPPGVRLMIDDGKVVRADVDSGSTHVAEGVGIGSGESEVISHFPGTVTQPHKYRSDSGWHYLVARPATPADSLVRFVFETDGKAVVTYRAGIEPFVEFVEGCG